LEQSDEMESDEWPCSFIIMNAWVYVHTIPNQLQ
jgi:hypothetical protein